MFWRQFFTLLCRFGVACTRSFVNCEYFCRFGCPSGQRCRDQYEFTCLDRTCIDIRRKCDGNRDCRNGEDEYNCPTRGNNDGTKFIRGSKKLFIFSKDFLKFASSRNLYLSIF